MATFLQTEKTLLTRGDAAKHLAVSPKEWDRIRKRRKVEGNEFTELHIVPGPKGLRFLATELDAFIRECIEQESH